MSEIKNFIDAEKRFAEFKIKTLERTSSPAKLRLIKMEREFISFDFSKLNSNSIEEMRSAMNLFRISRSEFLRKHYLIGNDDSFDLQCQFFLKKISEISINEAGIIDGYSFRALSGSEVLNIDGTIRSIYSKFLTMCKEILSMMHAFSIKNGRIPKDIFEVFSVLNYDRKVAPYILSNMDFLTSDDIESIIHKTEKTSLLVTKIPHSGNEKINIISFDFFDNENNKITPKKNKFVNVSIDGSYRKAVLFDRADSEAIDFDKSFVGVGKSRRFSEHLLDLKVWAKLILLEAAEI